MGLFETDDIRKSIGSKARLLEIYHNQVGDLNVTSTIYVDENGVAVEKFKVGNHPEEVRTGDAVELMDKTGIKIKR